MTALWYKVPKAWELHSEIDMRDSFGKLFERELSKLKSEIEAYSNEENLWLVSGEIINSGGNLVCHLIGNLNHYIGALLGQTGYVRDRPLEFSIKDVPRAKLLAELEKLNPMIQHVLANMPDTIWKEEYPEEVLGYPMSYEYFFIHLIGHLNYHLGQLNYHRRLLDKAFDFKIET